MILRNGKLWHCNKLLVIVNISMMNDDYDNGNTIIYSRTSQDNFLTNMYLKYAWPRSRWEILDSASREFSR